MKRYFLVGALALGSLAVACGGSNSSGSSPDEGASGDEQDITKAGVCQDVKKLHCAADFEVSEDGCASPHFVGAPTYGRCVGVDAKSIEGSWNDLSDANAGEVLFYSFTFESDGTYTAQGGCRPPKPGEVACKAIMQATGRWGIIRSGPQLGAPGGVPEIQTIDSFNQKTSYFYSLSGGKLSLKTGYNGKASVFTKGLE